MHRINIKPDFAFDILSVPSKHYADRNDTMINSIVVHAVGLPLETLFEAFDQYQVSAHYLVPQLTGEALQQLLPQYFADQTLHFPHSVPVIQLVAPEYKAFHAGPSCFRDFNTQPECKEGLNACSIGIEFHCPGYAKGDGSDWYHFTPYTEQQKETGMALIAYLMRQYQIPAHNLLAHSTIAVGRKTDPGPLFFWEDLHKANLAYLPAPIETQTEKKILFVQNTLLAIGFVDCPQTGVVDAATQDHINAYIMQYVPALWQGNLTPITQDLLSSLAGFA